MARAAVRRARHPHLRDAGARRCAPSCIWSSSAAIRTMLMQTPRLDASRSPPTAPRYAPGHRPGPRRGPATSQRAGRESDARRLRRANRRDPHRDGPGRRGAGGHGDGAARGPQDPVARHQPQVGCRRRATRSRNAGGGRTGGARDAGNRGGAGADRQDHRLRGRADGHSAARHRNCCSASATTVCSARSCCSARAAPPPR